MEIENLKGKNGTIVIKGKIDTYPVGRDAKPANRNCRYKHQSLGNIYPDCCGICSRGGNQTFGTFDFFTGPVFEGKDHFEFKKDWPLSDIYGNTVCENFTLVEKVQCNGQDCTLTYDNPKGYTKFFLHEFGIDPAICSKERFSGCELHDPTGMCSDILWICDQGFSFKRSDSPDPLAKPTFNYECSRNWPNFQKGIIQRIDAVGCRGIRVQPRIGSFDLSHPECDYVSTMGTGIRTGQVVMEEKPSMMIEGENTVLVSKETQFLPGIKDNSGENIIVDAIILIIEVAFLLAGVGGLGLSVWNEEQIKKIEDDLINLEKQINADIVTIQSAINTDRQSMRDLEAVSIVNTAAINTILITVKINEFALNSTKACELLKGLKIKVTFLPGGGCIMSYPYGELLNLLSLVDTNNITLNNVTIDNNFGGGLNLDFWTKYGSWIGIGIAILAFLLVVLPIIRSLFKK